MHRFWAVIKHFIDPITKELVHFVTGDEEKQVFRELVSEDQASSYMFDGAMNGGRETVDNEAFFRGPFDRTYGEAEN